MENKRSYVKYSLCGALAGIVNGVLGSGGGIVLVPLFLLWLKLPSKKAFASSVSVTLPMSIVAASVCLLSAQRDISPVLASSLPYLAGGAAGGLLGGLFFKKLPALWLHRIFGALLIFGGVRAVFF